MGREQSRGGITAQSVLMGSALFLALAWGLPYWSLGKDYALGMGGYLPLEALVLTLLLLAFNRFGGALAMVAGVVAMAVFVPYWHGATHAKTPAEAHALPAVGTWLYEQFSGLISQGKDSPWTTTLLTLAGALVVFIAAALPTWLVSITVPWLRRRLIWRELLVVFVLVAVGIYSCRAVEFMVGTLTVPYKDDDISRRFRERFVRPIPFDQDPENLAGIPSAPMPYDIHDFYSAEFFDSTGIKDKPEKQALYLDAFKRVEAKTGEKIPTPESVGEQLAKYDAVAAGTTDPDKKKSLEATRSALFRAPTAPQTAGGLYAEFVAAVDAAVKAAGADYKAPTVQDSARRTADGWVVSLGIARDANLRAAAAEREAMNRFRSGIRKSLPDSEDVELIQCRADAAIEWLKTSTIDEKARAEQSKALTESLAAFRAARDLGAASKAMGALQKAIDTVQTEKNKADKAANVPDQEWQLKTEPYLAKYKGQGREVVSMLRDSEHSKFMSHWWKPLKWWLPLLAMILLLQVFLAALLRRQWIDHEKLMFPHAEAVRSLVEGEDLSSRSRKTLGAPMFWIGAGLIAVIYLFQGLNSFFPAVPAPNLHDLSIKTFISERPWTNMQKTVSIQPYLVAISYLLTSEVSLSIWVFGVINQGLRVGAGAWGMTRDDSWALHGEGINSDALYAGAMLIFVAWLAWGARRHIWYVARRGLGLAPADANEHAEPMGYPLAFWGFWLCTAGILGWCVLLGLKLWIMLVLFGLYMAIVVLITRLVAEAGLLTAGAGFWPFYPQFVFSWVFGFGQGAGGKMIAYNKGWLGASAGAGNALLIPTTVKAFGVWSFIWPSMLHVLPLSPFLLTGFKLTETEPRRKRLLTWAMVAVVFIGVAIFLHGALYFAFDRGSQATGFDGYSKCWSWVFNNWLIRDVVNKERMWTYDIFRMGMMFAGAVVMTLLLIFRSVFYWWPLHPIGMVATGIDGIWICFLIGWLFKRAALAYGGGEFSQKINPLFYGMIVGQFVMAAFWALLGLSGAGGMTGNGLLPGMGG